MFSTGLGCKDDEPVKSGGLMAQVTFLPALTSCAVMPGGLLGGQVQ